VCGSPSKATKRYAPPILPGFSPVSLSIGRRFRVGLLIVIIVVVPSAAAAVTIGLRPGEGIPFFKTRPLQVRTSVLSGAICCKPMRSFFRRIRSAAYSVLPALAFLNCLAVRPTSAARSSTNRAAVYVECAIWRRLAISPNRLQFAGAFAPSRHLRCGACSQGDRCGLELGWAQ